MSEWAGPVALLSAEMIHRASSYYTLGLARELSRREIPVELVCAGGALSEQFRASGIKVTEIRHIEERLRGWFKRHALRTHFYESRPAILHVQTAYLSLLGQKLAWRMGIPMAATVHGGQLGWWRMRALRSKGVRAIAVSEPLREDLVNVVRMQKERVTVIPNGVEIRDYPVSPMQVNKATMVVGIIGPLVSIKGHEHFLRASREVLRYASDVQFLVAGTGPEEWNLRRLARQLGIESNVTFAIGASDYKPLLQTIDIFVFPSLEEGLGFNVLEAMASGRPAVTSSVGGLYSVVRDGETGFLVQRGDYKAMAEKVLQLIRDPEKARQMGAQARKVVEEEFDIRNVADRTLTVYQEALAEGR